MARKFPELSHPFRIQECMEEALAEATKAENPGLQYALTDRCQELAALKQLIEIDPALVSRTPEGRR